MIPSGRDSKHEDREKVKEPIEQVQENTKPSNNLDLYTNSEGYSVKPIRLAKREEKKKDEFQCRPIRLSSRRKGSGSETAHNDTMNNRKSTMNRKGSLKIRNLPVMESHTYESHHTNVNDMIFGVCLVDFHHARGPEIQWWRSNYHPQYPEDNQLFKNLPFQAMPDGSHLFEETFSNFNLVYDFRTGKSYDDGEDYDTFKGDPRNLKTLFGCSCVRQIKLSDLSETERQKNKDFTRSIVQKGVVVISRSQPIFQVIKEKLSIITYAYFAQDDFHNTELLDSLFENLNSSFKLPTLSLHQNVTSTDIGQLDSSLDKQEEFFINLNLKETFMKFKSDLLIILKALLLEKRVLIYSNSNLELLTQFQNNIISLIPNLINNLDNSGCPLSDFEETDGPLRKPNTLNTTSRESMLRFFGSPLQIFNTKGSFWNPYLPLQQLSELYSPETKSFMVGCSNLLFVNHLASLNIDLLINLDTCELKYPVKKPEELNLSWYDKYFIDFIFQSNKKNIMEGVTMGKNEIYIGSDDFVRYQFENYLLSLLATTRYDQYMQKFNQPPPGFSNTTFSTKRDSYKQNDNSLDREVAAHVNNSENGKLALFNKKFYELWCATNNYRIWNSMADEFIFNFICPKHIGVELRENKGSIIYSFFNNFKSNSVGDNLPLSNHEVSPRKFIRNPVEPNENTGENSAENPREEEDTEESQNTKKPLSERISSWTNGWTRRK